MAFNYRFQPLSPSLVIALKELHNSLFTTIPPRTLDQLHVYPTLSNKIVFCNHFTWFGHVYPQQRSDYTSSQSTMRPITEPLRQTKPPQSTQLSAASPSNGINRDHPNSYEYQYSQDVDGYTSTQSAKEVASISDKCNEPALSSSTDFADLSRSSSSQEDGKSFGRLVFRHAPRTSATPGYRRERNRRERGTREKVSDYKRMLKPGQYAGRRASHHCAKCKLPQMKQR
jgi:hypothetical protein